MPRIARVVVPNMPHHITQRGNRREDVFFSDDDRRRYLDLLAKYSAKHGLDLVAYCLMSNHVHLVVIPRAPESLAGTLKPLHLRYAQHVNWTQNLTGRLWQGRFFSCPLDERHFLAAVRYVEQNPVRAGLLGRAEEYPWSSAAAHCGLRKDHLLTKTTLFPENISDWTQWLCNPEQETMVKTLRKNTLTGRPAGSDAFINRLEGLLGRILRPQKGGRPSKDLKKQKRNY